MHSQLPNNGILKNSCCNIDSVRLQYFLVQSQQSWPYTRKYRASRAGSIFSRIGPALLALYKKILQSHGVNTRKYWLIEVIENDCIVTRVWVYDEISPELSGNPSGSALGISLRHRRYFIIQLQYHLKYCRFLATKIIFNCNIKSKNL